MALLIGFPITSDVSAWYAVHGWVILAIILALSTWAFRTALGRRPLLRDEFLAG